MHETRLAKYSLCFYIYLRMSIIKVKTFMAFIVLFKVPTCLRSPVVSSLEGSRKMKDQVLRVWLLVIVHYFNKSHISFSSKCKHWLWTVYLCKWIYSPSFVIKFLQQQTSIRKYLKHLTENVRFLSLRILFLTFMFWL